MKIKHLVQRVKDIILNDRDPMTDSHNEDAFRSIFHNALDILIIIDIENGRIVEANETTKRVLGYSPKALKGQPFENLFPNTDGKSVEEQRENIKFYDSVIVGHFLRADGSTLVMDLTVTPIPWDGEVAMLATIRDATERIHAEEEREALIVELREAMERIKTLKGLLPICAHCKNIRNDEGYWQKLEAYVSEHSEATFSHGICPDCIKKHYPEYYKE